MLLRRLALACLLPAAAAAAETESAAVTLLAGGDVSGWEYQTFDDIPETAYQTVADEDGRLVLQATSRGGASGYTRRQEIDLYDTPWLHFRWRVPQADRNTAEKTRAGDDYAWRIYFVGRGGMEYRALTFVYSQSAAAAGEQWMSPYAAFLRDIRIVALAAADEEDGGQWQTAAINAGELWRAAFGDDGRIGLIGLMTDGDNAGLTMQAEYGDIVLSAAAVL